MLASDATTAPFTSKDLVSQHMGLVDKKDLILIDGVSSQGHLTWLSRSNQSPVLIATGHGVLTCLTPCEGQRWEESFIFGNTAEKFMAVTTNKNNNLIAASTSEGTVMVWQVAEGELADSSQIYTVNAGASFTSLGWFANKSEQYLLALTATQWAKVNLPFTSTMKNKKVVSIQEGKEKESSVKKVVKNVEEVEVEKEEEEEEYDDVIQPLVNFSQAPLEESVTTTHNSTTDTAPVRKRLHKTTALGELVDLPRTTATTSPLANNTISNIANNAEKSLASKPTAARNNDDDADDKFLEEPTTSDKVPTTNTIKARSLFSDEASDAGDEEMSVQGGDENKDEMVDFVDVDLDMVTSKGALTITPALLEEVRNQIIPRKQEPFQPSTTRPDAQNRRYLVWNHVGSIVTREESLENRIEIRFTSTSSGHRQEAFPDRSGFTMAALCQEGAIFATPPEEKPQSTINRDYLLENDVEKLGKGSMIYYHAFPGRQFLGGANAPFRWTLPPGEGALGLAAGKGWLAVATSRKFLRLFSATGTEISVSWLTVTVMEINASLGGRGRIVVENLPVPLSADSRISWLGYACDMGLPAIVDTRGLLSILIYNAVGYQWMPVMDIQEVRKTIDQSYWPITIRGDKLVYVLLHGESKPSVFPQPVVSVKSLRMLLCTHKEGRELNEADKEKLHRLVWEEMKVCHMEHLLTLPGASALQEDLAEAVEKQSLEADKTILKVFQEACAKDDSPLALSFASRLRGIQSLEAAIVIADHFGRTQVAQTLDEIVQYRKAIQYQAEAAVSAGSNIESIQQGGGPDYAEEEEEANYEYNTGVVATSSSNSSEGGILSRKVSLKSSMPPLHTSSSKSIVTPEPEDVGSPSTKPVNDDNNTVNNPFAVKKTGQTPIKRKTLMEGVKDLVSSPSPKKPALSRLSTFSQTARNHRLADKKML
eukprot:scaffold300_cov173-Ochromonas_danica.AAC.17